MQWSRLESNSQVRAVDYHRKPHKPQGSFKFEFSEPSSELAPNQLVFDK